MKNLYAVRFVLNTRGEGGKEFKNLKASGSDYSDAIYAAERFIHTYCDNNKLSGYELVFLEKIDGEFVEGD